MKLSKYFILKGKSFLGNFNRHLVIFGDWSHWMRGRELRPSQPKRKSLNKKMLFHPVERQNSQSSLLFTSSHESGQSKNSKLLKWSIPSLFFVYFRSFLNKHDNILKCVILGLFFFIFDLSIELTVNVQYNFANDWIRTADLWNRKQPLYQLSHNHCPPTYSLNSS